jgi:threonine/homoserine/homoserine lactone efflux protein
LGFVATALLIGVLPGPAVTSIVGYALGSGRCTALASVLGVSVSTLIATSLSLAGVGAVLRASSLAFMVLKWAGAAYLVGLGLWALWQARAGAETDALARPPISARSAFLSNVALGSFHPKTIAFFAAFAPQFIDPKAAYLPQAVCSWRPTWASWPAPTRPTPSSPPTPPRCCAVRAPCCGPSAPAAACWSQPASPRRSRGPSSARSAR